MSLDLDLLCNLLSVPSPSGSESKVAEYYTSALKEFGQVEIDVINNAYCHLNASDDAPVIMLEAHSDEVGLQVSHITDDGFVYCRRNGAIDNQALIGCEVVIHGKDSDVIGVVGKKPIHLIGTDIDKVPSIEDMWIDIFAGSRQEAEKKVSIGDYVTYNSGVRAEGDKVVSKSLDDKIGVFIIAEAIKRLSSEHIPVNVWACACAQEEVGSRGCHIAANKIKPDYAICIDTGFATDYPSMTDQKYGRMKLGSGPVINYSCDNNQEFVQLIRDTAGTNGIPHQLYTNLAATGGTDTAAVQLSGNGVRTALISIPCRYMHTPVEVCDLRDVENTISLVVEVIKTCSLPEKF